MSPESARPVTAGASMPGCHLLAQLGSRGGVAQREGLDAAQHLVDVLPARVAQLADGLVRGRGERAAQSLVGTCLELAGAPVGTDGGASGAR